MFVSVVKGIRKIFYTIGSVWIGQKIQSNGKWFLLTVKYQPLKCKIVYTPIFILLERERERERERALTWTPAQLPNPRHLKLKAIAIVFRTQGSSFSSLLSSSSIYKPISSSSPPSDPPTKLWSFTSLSHDRCLFFRKIDFFFLLFFCWFGLYIWISYYNICLEVEKIWEKVFSRGFSGTQPNNLKYFPKHFLWCDQTFENIFIFEKYFHLKIFYTLKSFYIEPNTDLDSCYVKWILYFGRAINDWNGLNDHFNFWIYGTIFNVEDQV